MSLCLHLFTHEKKLEAYLSLINCFFLKATSFLYSLILLKLLTIMSSLHYWKYNLKINICA